MRIYNDRHVARKRQRAVPLLPRELAHHNGSQSQRQTPRFMPPPAERTGGQRAMQDAREAHVPLKLWLQQHKSEIDGGDAAAVDRALALLQEQGVRKTVKLAVSVPSHTPLMREAANRLAETMAGLQWTLPALPVVQNVDARAHDDLDGIRDALVRQLYLPVQWTGCVQALAARGVTRIAECGPGKVLAGLVKRIDKSLDARALGTPADFAGAIEEWNA
jgi:acyl transferase domain-containing protein